jgi:hypothetical protein
MSQRRVCFYLVVVLLQEVRRSVAGVVLTGEPSLVQLRVLWGVEVVDIEVGGGRGGALRVDPHRVALHVVQVRALNQLATNYNKYKHKILYTAERQARG